MLGRPERLSAAAQEYLAALCARNEAIAAAHVLTREFTAIMRERRGDQLDAWLRSAGEGAVAELRRFAVGLATDRAAVQAGLTLPWSNGQVEGQIHRRKLVKRTMYGRAGTPPHNLLYTCFTNSWQRTARLMTRFSSSGHELRP